MTGLLLLACLYLMVALAFVPLATRAGLGSVLGFLAAGILLGPVLGIAGAATADLQHVAEFGVVMMLFLIGLELEPRALWDMRQKLLGLGGLQVVGTAAALAAAGLALGLGFKMALALGLILSLSSTAIVRQTLAEKRLDQSVGGRAAFAVLLMQDIAVVPMIAILPLLSFGAEPEVTAATYGIRNPGLEEAAAPHAETVHSLVAGLPAWGVTLLTLGIVAAIILGGHYLTRPIFRYVHAAHLPEMSTAMSLLIVLGIASAMSLVGLSPALGTFVAGVVLAGSEFRHQLEADLQPFKGLLMGLFFITVGAGIDFGVFLAQPVLILVLACALMAVKAAVLWGLGGIFALRGRDRRLFALALAQAGEFGFLLVGFSVQQSVLPPGLGDVATLAIGISMLLTPLLFLAEGAIARRTPDRRRPEPDEIDPRGPVIIIGIGRFGQVINRIVRSSGIETTVLDGDMETIQFMRRFGVKGFFGDPTRPELLEAAGLAKCSLLVVAVDNPKSTTRIVTYARSRRPDLHIVARAHDRVHVYELYQAGADDIVRELFDSSLRAARYVLENMGFTDYEAAQISQAYYRVDRRILRDLAELWQPGVPALKNEAYVQRARELDVEFESELSGIVEEHRRLTSPGLDAEDEAEGQ